MYPIVAHGDIVYHVYCSMCRPSICHNANINHLGYSSKYMYM